MAEPIKKPIVAEVKKAAFVVEWRDGFRVDIAQVDREHRRLFELIARLEVANVQATIDELLNYVVVHFTNEQKIMEESKYPGFADHLKLHEGFSQTVGEFIAADNWNEERVGELRKFLNKWLIGHIMTHDLRFGKWYRAHYGNKEPEVDAQAERRKVGWFDRLLGRG